MSAEVSKSILLLPPPPSPVTSASLSAAYQSSINVVASKLKDLSFSTELTVVVPCPNLHGRLRGARSLVYEEAQRLLGGIYSLVCAICATLKIEVESDIPGSIDSRVILLDYDGSHRVLVPSEYESVIDIFPAGPIIDLQTLAITRRKWNIIFSVDGEAGQQVFAEYSKLANQHTPPLTGHVQIVGGGVSLVNLTTPLEAPPKPAISHDIVAVGGTFDHLHPGHKLLLTATALLLQPAISPPKTNRRLIVGITGDELLKNKKYAEYLNSWQQRQRDVVAFLVSILLFTRSAREESIETLSFDNDGPNGHAIHTVLKSCWITIECVEIQDPFGPTITDESITALVVSGETRSGGQAVNDRRKEKGWRALEVFEVDVLDARGGDGNESNSDDFSSKISSTEIRKRRAEATRLLS